MIDATKKSKDSKEIKQLAEEYHVGMSTIHGAESFYEFLRPEHKEKKAWKKTMKNNALMNALIFSLRVRFKVLF